MWRFRPARSISRSSTSAFEPPGFFRGRPLPPGGRTRHTSSFGGIFAGVATSGPFFYVANRACDTSLSGVSCDFVAVPPLPLPVALTGVFGPAGGDPIGAGSCAAGLRLRPLPSPFGPLDWIRCQCRARLGLSGAVFGAKGTGNTCCRLLTTAAGFGADWTCRVCRMCRGGLGVLSVSNVLGRIGSVGPAGSVGRMGVRVA